MGVGGCVEGGWGGGSGGPPESSCKHGDGEGSEKALRTGHLIHKVRRNSRSWRSFWKSPDVCLQGQESEAVSGGVAVALPGIVTVGEWGSCVPPSGPAWLGGSALSRSPLGHQVTVEHRLPQVLSAAPGLVLVPSSVQERPADYLPMLADTGGQSPHNLTNSAWSSYGCNKPGALGLCPGRGWAGLSVGLHSP